MRGKVLLFVMLLAAGGVALGWMASRDVHSFLSPFLRLTSLASVPNRTLAGQRDSVRVNLGRFSTETLILAVDAPYAIRGLPGNKVLAGGELLRPTSITTTPEGFRLGPHRLSADALEIASDSSPAIWVGQHQYRGDLRLYRERDGSILAVNIVRLEDYVASVVDGEMPTNFPVAARQAQAVVARSYVLYQMSHAPRSALFDVYATTRSQNYLGYQYQDRDGRRYAAESNSSRRIAEQTVGIICLSKGRPFCTYYTAVCGGRTAGGLSVFDDSSPALASVDCDGCGDADLFRWSRSLSLREASSAFRRYFARRKRPFRNLASIRRTGPIEEVREPNFAIGDGHEHYSLSAVEMRRLLPSSSVPSLQFDAKIADGRLVLEGRGHGHGVGLCQWGARGMALSGSGPLEILRHYYPGAEVVRCLFEGRESRQFAAE